MLNTPISKYYPLTKNERVKPSLNYPSTTLEKLKRHMIFLTLIKELQNRHFVKSENLTDLLTVSFDVPQLSYSKQFSIFDDADLYDYGICSIPNFLLNALICEKLTDRFGDLSVCGCFRKIQKGWWRLDVDESLSRRGLFIPQRDRNGLIYGLKTMRYPDDPRPFILKKRSGN